jgi:hypothetical protein
MALLLFLIVAVVGVTLVQFFEWKRHVAGF